MWAILRVWTLINIPDNVITADTGTGGDTRVKVRFTLSRSRPGSRIWVWSISRAPGVTKPRHQNLQTALIWEHCEGSLLLGLLILSPDSSNPGNTTLMRAGANETWGNPAHWYSDLIVRRQGLRQSKLKSQNWNHHYWKYAWAWEWQPVKGGKVSPSRE